MQRILLIIGCLSMVYTSFADPLEIQFQAANEAFAKEQYAAATQQYEAILTEGKVSSALYFNLGNAYFRQEKIALAILNYERALRLAPHDLDIQHNLKLANQRTVDQITPYPPFILVRWWKDSLGFLGSVGWSILTIIALWVAVGGWFFWLFGRARTQRKRGFFMGLTFFAFSLLSGVMAWQAHQQQMNTNFAIIVSNETGLKTGADGKSPDRMTLHSGTKIEILDKIGDWRKIRLMNGEEGWLKVGSFEVI